MTWRSSSAPASRAEFALQPATNQEQCSGDSRAVSLLWTPDLKTIPAQYMAHSTFEFHCAHVSSNLLSPSCQQEIFPSLPSLCFSGFLAFSTPSPFSFSTSHKGPSAGQLWAAFPVSPVSRWSQPFLNKMVRHHVCMKTSECVNKSEDRVLHRPKCESDDNKCLKTTLLFSLPLLL